MGEKKNKSHVISWRCSDDELVEILMKVCDEDGVEMMKPSAYSRAATLGGHVTIVDSELERYKAFVLARQGNLRNQMVKCLHQDRKAGIVTEKTYISILEQMHKEEIAQNKLLEPLR